MPAAIHVWTEADRQTVAELLLAGKSARLIGAALGRTRNAIIGKLHRDDELHRLVGKQYSKIRIKRDKPPKKPRQKTIPPLAVKPDPWQQPGKKPDGVATSALSPPIEPLPGMRRVPLIKLRRNECRFAVKDDAQAIGGYLFCGRPTTPDEMYCREHRAIASPGRRGDG